MASDRQKGQQGQDSRPPFRAFLWPLFTAHPLQRGLSAPLYASVDSLGYDLVGR